MKTFIGTNTSTPMLLKIDNQEISKFIMVGDRVLIKPRKDNEKTKGGLLLPPGVEEKRQVQWGYVIKTGPGYPIPSVTENDEPWKEQGEQTRYIPLQANEGDLAIYIKDNGIEIEFEKEKYLILPHSAILVLIRDEKLFA